MFAARFSSCSESFGLVSDSLYLFSDTVLPSLSCPLNSYCCLFLVQCLSSDVELFSRQLQDGRRGDSDGTRVPFTVGEIETSASQLNGQDHFVHRGSGSGRQGHMVDEAGQCLPVVSGHHVHDHSPISSVGSVSSSTQLAAAAAAGNAVSRLARCESSSSDIASSLAAAQRDEVSEFFSFRLCISCFPLELSTCLFVSVSIRICLCIIDHLPSVV